MATKKKEALKSWEDVDAEIRKVAELDLEIDGRKYELDTERHKVEAKHTPAIAKLMEERSERADAILAFAQKHREELGEKKSKKFNFGTISFSKVAQAVKFLVDEEKLIANLKKLGYALGVVKSKESVDKNALQTAVPESKRAAAGFELVDTGNEPQLKIDRKAIEAARPARVKKAS